IEGGCQTPLLVIIASTIPEMRLADTGGDVPPDDPAVRILALDFVAHQILGNDHIPFHADHLGDLGDAARTVTQAGSLDDDVDGAGYDLTDGLGRQAETTHGDHRFHAAQAFARRIGVDRAHGAVVTSVHRLQQVEDLGSAHFADDNA